MGGFVLLRHDADAGRAPAVLQSFEKHGSFGGARRFESTHWRLVVYAKLGGQPAAVHVKDAENFAAGVGTFLYRGLIGSEALARFFEDVEGDCVAWREAYGSYCIILQRRGRLTLIPDRLGVYKVYRNADGTVISSSFLAVLESIDHPRADVQSVYEYVFQGATYDERTVIEQVRLMERNASFALDRDIRIEKRADDLWEGPRWSAFEPFRALTLDALREEFAGFARAFGNNIDTALSGGYDSRLILALLREQGLAPRVHVYGAAESEDVRIAREIAAGEGFFLDHTDKSARPPVEPAGFPAIVARNFSLFDGYPADGIFDAGSDAETRQRRTGNAGLALNGGGGEIFRNFFYLADRSFRLRDIMWAFFSQFDPAVCTAAFVEENYLARLATAVAHLLNIEPGEDALALRLSRQQIEYLYPCFRCVYWMGRNNSVNNRFGYYTTPFIEPALVQLGLQIPMRFKAHGKFEAALIRDADPALAHYPSAYGQPLDEAPTLKRRFKSGLTVLRPVRVRRLSYRLQNRLHRPGRRSEIYGPAYLSTVLDPSFPEMKRYFHPEKIANEAELNRICTLEYLFETYHVVS